MSLSIHAVRIFKRSLIYDLTGFPSQWLKWPTFAPTSFHTTMLSEESLEQMTRWIRECRRNHRGCSLVSNPALPSRLLRLSWSGNYPKLHLEAVDQARQYEYVALSHVWNLTSPLRTTISNFLRHLEDIPFRTLSKALQDTVVLALSLGYSYVWIDSLCIIQDRIGDWEGECPRMASIYRGASVVFAVHHSELGLETSNPVKVYEPTSSDSADNPIYASHFVDHHDCVMDGEGRSTDIMFSRGWCMQERFFASRLLYFGGHSSEVSFECNEKVACQCKASYVERDSRQHNRLKCKLPRTLKSIHMDPERTYFLDELFEVFCQLIEQYTKMDLTYANDTLPAISSPMAEFSPYMGTYCGGLWERRFIPCLLWWTLYSCNASRQKEYIAPSFSWASVKGAIQFRYRVYRSDGPLVTPSEKTHLYAKVLVVSSEVAGKDRFGRVAKGHMRLRGSAITMLISRMTQDGKGLRARCTLEGHELQAKRSTTIELDTIDAFKELKNGDRLLCLAILRIREPINLYRWEVAALILRPVDGTNSWRRIGITYHLSLGHFEGSKEHDVTVL